MERRWGHHHPEVVHLLRWERLLREGSRVQHNLAEHNLAVSQDNLEPWVNRVNRVNRVNLVNPQKPDSRASRDNLANLVNRECNLVECQDNLECRDNLAELWRQSMFQYKMITSHLLAVLQRYRKVR